MGNTKITLPEDIAETLYLGKVEFTEDQLKMAEEIIKNAKDGLYDDFESVLPFPKTKLHEDLLEAGLVDIDKKMIRGEYDE